MVRTFRNNEEESIEATLTFPLPVHAVLYSLEACIAGRTLKAVARAKATARQTYEDAIETGKSTVLHEELLKGAAASTICCLSLKYSPKGISMPSHWCGGGVYRVTSKRTAVSGATADRPRLAFRQPHRPPLRPSVTID